MKWPSKVGAFCTVLLMVLSSVAGSVRAQSPSQLGCPLEPGPTRTVARVLDGATVELDDRSVVRLIGVLAPRAEDAGAESGNWPAETESHAALAALALGRSVVLAFSGARGDRHGRVLAHLFRDDGEKQLWVQGQLVELGAARVFAPPGGEACVAALIEREARAREAARGLWSVATYAPRPADRPTELARYQGTFQLVRGRVGHVQTSRSLTVLYLQSAEAPPLAYSAKAQQRSQHGVRVLVRHGTTAARALGKLSALGGQDVLVRGWIVGRGSPEIEIVAEGQLQIVPKPPVAENDAA